LPPPSAFALETPRARAAAVPNRTNARILVSSVVEIDERRFVGDGETATLSRDRRAEESTITLGLDKPLSDAPSRLQSRCIRFEAPMSLTIRSAAPADAALVHTFVRELAEYERLAHEIDATPEMIAGTLFAERPRVFADIAEWSGEPAGMALWFYNFSTFRGRHGIYLEDLFVRPALRGHGVGKALLAGLARRCVAEGLARLGWAVLDWNAPSIAFYRALGAVAKEEWTGYQLTGDALARLGAATPR
jgi:GNAT superfamily N-acetyltransferase